MMDQLVTKILLYVLSALGTFIVSTLIPLIVKKIGATNLQKLKNLADIAVRAAEQIYGPKTAAEKKAYVIKYLKSKMGWTMKLGLKQDQLDTIIESAVFEVSSAVKTEVQSALTATKAQELLGVTKPSAVNKSTNNTDSGLKIS